DEARDRIAVLESSACVRPLAAVGYDVGDVFAPRHFGGVHDAHQLLLGTVHRGVAPEHGGGRALHRIDAGGLVADHHPVGGAGGGGLEAHLPVDVIRAEEGQVHTRIASTLGRVVHLFGPVLVMASREKRLVPQQLGAVGMGIDIGGVGDV